YARWITPRACHTADTSRTDSYTLSLHDALPILGADHDRRRPDRPSAPGRNPPRRGRPPPRLLGSPARPAPAHGRRTRTEAAERPDRKSTRLNSSHVKSSYAVLCLKKKRRRIHIL